MPSYENLRSESERVLRQNDRGRFTVPSPRLYPHQWAWDSAFAAIGWSYLDCDRAWVELETLLGGQWKDGRVPHIIFHNPDPNYFPGPAFWEAEGTSTISQPPIWATAIRRVYERDGDKDRMRALLGPTAASHSFFLAQRDPHGRGAVAVAHPWESGLDNAPVWDLPLSQIDISNPPPFERKDTSHVDPSMRPTDEQYAAYVCIVKEIAAGGFFAGSFNVYDPLMTAILAKAEEDLLWLGKEADVDTGSADRLAATEEGLTSLWNEDLGRYDYIDASTKMPQRCFAVGTVMPLIVERDLARRARLEENISQLLSHGSLLPSVAPSDPQFNPRCYWRGPAWVNTAWLLNKHLGDSLREPTLEAMNQNGIYEYFHPITAEPLGGEEFTWSAALALDWLSRS